MNSTNSMSSNGSKDEKSSVAHLTRELKGSASQVGSAIKNATTAISEDLGTAANDMYKSVVDTGRKSAEQLADEVETRVQDSPLLAIGIAFGLGMLLSSMLTRRA